MMMLLVSVGLFHALVSIPVLLSIAGPSSSSSTSSSLANQQ